MLTRTQAMAKDENGNHPFLKTIKKSQSPYLSGLFYGPSGSGKTSILGSAGYDERTGPIIVLGADDSLQSLRGTDPDRVTPVVISKWEELTAAWDYLTFEKHPYKSVAIDGLTDLHIYSMLTLMEAKTEASDRRNSITTAEQSDYGDSMAQIRRVLILFKRLKMNVFFTAQPKQMSIAKRGFVQVPSMFGQLAMEIAGAFDICIYVSPTPMHDVSKDKTAKAPSVNNSGDDISRYAYFRDQVQLLTKVRTAWLRGCPEYVRISQKDAMTDILDALGV